MNRATENAARAIIALPDDDWQPEHWATFFPARDVLAAEIGRIDRRTQASAAEKAARAGRDRSRFPDRWTLSAARSVVSERSGDRCEYQTPNEGRCPDAYNHVHHLAGRGGANPHHPENLIALCEMHHLWAHSHPADAREAGLMRSRLAVTQ